MFLHSFVAFFRFDRFDSMWSNRNRRLIRFDATDQDFDSTCANSQGQGAFPLPHWYASDSISIRLRAIHSDFDSVSIRFRCSDSMGLGPALPSARSTPGRGRRNSFLGHQYYLTNYSCSTQLSLTGCCF